MLGYLLLRGQGETDLSSVLAVDFIVGVVGVIDEVGVLLSPCGA